MSIEPKELTPEQMHACELVAKELPQSAMARLLAHIEWQRQEIERLRNRWHENEDRGALCDALSAAADKLEEYAAIEVKSPAQLAIDFVRVRSGA